MHDKLPVVVGAGVNLVIVASFVQVFLVEENFTTTDERISNTGEKALTLLAK